MAVRHPERLEDVARDVLVVRLAGDDLDHQPQDLEAGVPVLVARARRGRQGDLVEAADPSFEGARVVPSSTGTTAHAFVGMPLVWFRSWRIVIGAAASSPPTRNHGRTR